MQRADAIKLVVAGLAAVGGVASLLVFGRGGSELGERCFYYDESAEKLFVGSSELVPPVQGVDGPERDASRAFVFGCDGKCGTKDRVVLYLMKHADAAVPIWEAERAARAANQPGPEQTADRRWRAESTLVRKFGEAEWFSLLTERGMEIQSLSASGCGEGLQWRACAP